MLAFGSLVKYIISNSADMSNNKTVPVLPTPGQIRYYEQGVPAIDIPQQDKYSTLWYIHAIGCIFYTLKSERMISCHVVNH